MARVELSEAEADLISDRLTADALAEVFECEAPADLTEAAIDVILRSVEERALDLDGLSPFEMDVLDDCIAGSTWVAAVVSAVRAGEEKPSELRRRRRIAADLTNKLRDAGWAYCPEVPRT